MSAVGTLPGPVVCVIGPTATGKSEVADLVATAFGSVVVSVDAMQVYRGMDVGTAKLAPQSRHAPLLMVDVADVDEDFSVQRFQGMARACIDKCLDRGKTPVLCGGTGLYLNAVIDEMEFPAGALGDERRTYYEKLERELGPDGLHALLAERDPASAALIHPNNTRRVVRALEMLDEGVSYAEHHEGLNRRVPHYGALIWGLTRDRQALYARIDERVDDMYAHGLLDEVRHLSERFPTWSKTASQAIGYAEALACLAGTMNEEEARERTKVRTRRYAKRQLSWFGHDARVTWIDMDTCTTKDAAARITESVRGGAHA